MNSDLGTERASAQRDDGPSRRTVLLGAGLGAGLLASPVPSEAQAPGARAPAPPHGSSDGDSLSGMTPPDSEQQRIRDLVTANHILADQGINDGFGHVSVRSLDHPGDYYLSRSRAPELVTEADIMRYDRESNPIGAERILYEERYIHGEIYKAHPDAQCVIHCHTPSVLTFGILGIPLRPVMHMAAFLPDEVPLFEIRDVEGPDNHILVTNPRSGAALAQKLGDGSVVLMRGHGMAVVGANVRQAVYRAIYTGEAAEVQARAMAMRPGAPINYLNAQERASFGSRLNRMGDPAYQPLRPWPIWEAHADASIAAMFGGHRP